MKSNLTTLYAGLSLRNPIIISSSGLTSSFEKIRAAAMAGAGAVVLKSIFEEQLTSQAATLDQYSDYPEAFDYLNSYVKADAMSEYLDLIGRSSKELSIPIIASINCSTKGEWVSYAKKIEQAGASALELNIFSITNDPCISSSEIEAKYLSIVESVRSTTTMPIIVKLPQGFTNTLNMVEQLYFRGVKGVVLFNRFYSPDIDLQRMEVISSGVFSSRSELSAPLRYTALCYASTPLIDIAISTGVHTGSDALKAILAGAAAVEICTSLYENGVDYISVILAEMEQWMIQKNFTSISAFKGVLSANKRADAEIFERAQFMKYYSSR